MIVHLESWLRRIGRLFNRSEWVVKVLGLGLSTKPPTESGLILIQIDGLSRTQFENALGSGKLPFLDRLLKSENYSLHSLYSGVPSTTPAVQGELFYGIKQAVPAFSFRESQSNKIVSMLDSEPVRRIERELQNKADGLLKGGSSYLNVLGGGACEPYFCPGTFGLGDFLHCSTPLKKATIVLWYAISIVRVLVLMLIEFVLAFLDFVRGMIQGRDLIKELKFVPTRVFISILARELNTIGACLDATRGLPIIHLNYLGYDEQAHRRGPSSTFAHWSLKGIDFAIKKVWCTAQRSPRRQYDVWVYSDHGQESTIPYPVKHSKSLQQAVGELFDEFPSIKKLSAAEESGIQSERVRWLAGDRKTSTGCNNKGQEPAISLAAMGPLGHLYFDRELSDNDRQTIATKLVKELEIPLVLIPLSSNSAEAFTVDGKFVLPNNAKEILGSDHPFLADACNDLLQLCHHRDAGDIILSGWSYKEQPLSFPIENGAHAGPGYEETHGFALLTKSSPLPDPRKQYLRPLDLRDAALRLLGREDEVIYPKLKSRGSTSNTLRLMTYNVHSCKGMDGHISPERIARVISEYSPDIIALQELDVARPRSNNVDQAHEIARLLEMDFHFHPAISLEEELYGDAILSHLPLKLVKADVLFPPPSPWNLSSEPRGALWVELCYQGKKVQIINTHLGLSKKERLCHIHQLLGTDWLQDKRAQGPLIFCGDFNAMPSSLEYRLLTEQLEDAQERASNQKPKRTWFGRYPLMRIDHVFISQDIEVVAFEVPRTELTKLASDHMPLVVDLVL